MLENLTPLTLTVDRGGFPRGVPQDAGEVSGSKEMLMIMVF